MALIKVDWKLSREADEQFTVIGPFEVLITNNVTLITTINHNLKPARAAIWLEQVVTFLKSQETK